MTARLGILLSGGGTTYQNLADHISRGDLDAEIAVVVGSRAGLGGLDLAKTNGHAHVIARAADEVTAALADAGADYVIMCGWLKFWDPPARWHEKVLNIHPALLPAFGGKGMYGQHVHAAVIAHGARVSGCTAHLVQGDYDTGPILAQATVPVLIDDDAISLGARVQAAERDLYPRIVRALIDGDLQRLDDGRYHCPSLEETP